MNTHNSRMIVWFSRHAELCAEQAKQCLDKADRPDQWNYPAEYIETAHSWALSWLAAVEYLEGHREYLEGHREAHGTALAEPQETSQGWRP